MADGPRGLVPITKLSSLPAELDKLRETVGQMATSSDRQGETLAQLEANMSREVDILTRLDRVNYQKHVALRGFGPLAQNLRLSRIELIHNGQLDQGAALRAHLQLQDIDPHQLRAHSLAAADLVYRAIRDEKEIYLVCETPVTARQDDFQRAQERAEILAELTGRTALAVVIATATDAPDARAEYQAEYVEVYRD